MDNYNKLFMIIRKTDLLNYDEKNKLQLYLMNLEQQCKKQKGVIDKLSEIIYELYDLKETTGGYPSHYVDDLVNILKRVSK